jgi:hypothetical protein
LTNYFDDKVNGENVCRGERESLEKESVTEIKWCRILKNLPGYYEVGTKH